jgi:uncharacterized protein YggT (Ycf19 family)
MNEPTPARFLRFTFLISLSVCGGIFDWSTFGMVERFSTVSIPAFNYAFTWFIRSGMVFILISYFATWKLCVGRRTRIQRLLFWVSVPILPFVAPVMPALGKLQGSAVIGVLLSAYFPIAVFSMAAYVFALKRLQRAFPELHEGVNLDGDPLFSDHYSQVMTSILFFQFPPSRRTDMFIIDILMAMGIWYVVRGSWFITQ